MKPLLYLVRFVDVVRPQGSLNFPGIGTGTFQASKEWQGPNLDHEASERQTVVIYIYMCFFLVLVVSNTFQAKQNAKDLVRLSPGLSQELASKAPGAGRAQARCFDATGGGGRLGDVWADHRPTDPVPWWGSIDHHPPPLKPHPPL